MATLDLTSVEPYDALIIRHAPQRINNLWADLWPDNVINGEKWLRRAKYPSVFMADIADILIALWRAGVISPIKFNPSISRAAFLGLDSCQHGAHNTPNHSDAADWDWGVNGDYTTYSDKAL